MQSIIKILSLFLLITYSTYVFRVVLPIMEFGLNYSNIISELCEEKENPDNSCLGKCHLKKQIQKQVDGSTNETKIAKIDFIKIPHTTQRFVQVNNCFDSIKRIDCLYLHKELKNSLKPQLPPPKFS